MRGASARGPPPLEPLGDQAAHRLGDRVPGVLGRPLPLGRGAALVDAGRGAGRQRDEGGRPVGDEDQVAVVADHVGHRRRDDRLAGGHVLERLGGADPPGRVVQRPGHQADVEALQVAGQLGVAALAEEVELRVPRQRGRVDLDHRADQDDRADARGLGQAGDQVVVEPLVDDAVVAEDRPGQAGQVVGDGRVRVEGAGEVVGLDGRGEEVDVRVASGLGLVEAAPAREDDVGAGQEPVLGVDEPGGGVLEEGELVHAVVDDDLPGAEPVAVGGEHGRVEPADQRPAAADGGDVGLDEGGEVDVGAGGPVGPQDGDAGGDVEGVEARGAGRRRGAPPRRSPGRGGRGG